MPFNDHKEHGMRTRTKLAAATALLGAAATAVALPSTGGAQAGAPQQLTLHMNVTNGTQLHRGRPSRSERMATGDELIVRLRMAAPDGAPLGTAHTHCVNVGPKVAPPRTLLQCTQTYRFADGQIVTAGAVRFSELESLAVPVVGGSGAYRGVRGQLTAGAPVEGVDSVDVLDLDR
jgi:hypothetical protein